MCLIMSAPQSQVVQDFVQMTEDEETPQEWLHRIMDTSSREGSDYDINLLGKADEHTIKYNCMNVSISMCTKPFY